MGHNTWIGKKIEIYQTSMTYSLSLLGSLTRGGTISNTIDFFADQCVGVSPYNNCFVKGKKRLDPQGFVSLSTILLIHTADHIHTGLDQECLQVTLDMTQLNFNVQSLYYG